MLGSNQMTDHPLARALARWQKAEGLNNKELAEKLGTTEQEVSRWVNGHRDLPASRLSEFEDAMGVARGYLMAEAGLIATASDAITAIKADPDLTSHDRRALIALYESMVEHNRQSTK